MFRKTFLRIITRLLPGLVGLTILAGCDAETLLREAAAAQLEQSLTGFTDDVLSTVVLNLFGL